MKLALAQANKIIGNTGQNPAVGCVVVKNDTLISAGHTSLNGRPHAEINAINNSKTNLTNSSLYVTLEPCSHYGKTPPCIKSIYKNKIKKVFFSVYDPDIRSYKKSTNFLKKKKIFVNRGLYSPAINFFYKSYFKNKKKGLPFVTCKLAISKDFFTVSKKSKWITNKYSRGRVHLLRSQYECILTSSKSIIKDNPRLTCRLNGMFKKSPTKIILDKNLEIPLKSKILTQRDSIKTIIFYNKINEKKIKTLKKLMIKTVRVPLNKDGHIDLQYVLIKIKKFGFSRILIEAGTQLTSSFLKNKLVDEFKLFISNKNLNHQGSKSFKKSINFFLKNKKKIKEKTNLFGDQLISYIIK